MTLERSVSEVLSKHPVYYHFWPLKSGRNAIAYSVPEIEALAKKIVGVLEPNEEARD